MESSPSRAPQAPPGLAGRPPTHPYHPNARPYVGVWPDSTTTRRTKFCTRTQFDAAGKKHAHNLSKSGLNGLMMLPMPLREDGVALLDHERRRKSCRPLPLRTPQRNVSWRGGGVRGSDGRGRGAGRRAWEAHPSGSRPSAPSKRARNGQVAQCGQTYDTPTHMRGKSFPWARLAWASAGHVRARLSPARSDRSDRAAAHTCILSGGAPRSSRMSAVVLSSRCIKSRRDRSRGGFQHHPNNFLCVRIDPSCTQE